MTLGAPVWTTWRSENYLPYRDSNPDTSVVQPAASLYIDGTTAVVHGRYILLLI
jgi:hypothetical protein